MNVNPNIAVCIPCYNEAITISKVVSDFRRNLPNATIYVFDNNSTDGTATLAKKAGAVVIPEYRQGKGNVVRSIFRKIKADCYIMVDGDDTYPAECAEKMCSMVLDSKADMVIGDRLSSTYFQENKRPFHNIGNTLVRFLINHLFHSNVHDIMTGYRAFSPFFVKNYPILCKGFEIETEMTIFALDKNMLLQELPINYRDRPQGSISKLNTFKDGGRVLATIFLLFRDYKPFWMFSLISLLFLTCSVILFIPILIEYYRTGLVPRFPSLIISGIAAICCLLSFFCGLILDVIRKKHAQLFEILANK